MNKTEYLAFAEPELDLRLQERLEQLELRLAAVTKERDAMMPAYMQFGSWLPKHWHIAKDLPVEDEV